MADDGKAILKRFKQAKKRKTNWDTTYREALQYAAPQRETFDSYEPGVKKNQPDKVFDSTALSAMQKFASNMQSSLMPPMKKWINLVPGAQIPEAQRNKAAKQLEEIRDTMFRAVNNSNFDTQISESFLDLAIGTGALLILKGTDANPIRCVSVPLAELFLEEGPHGIVTTAFREHKMPGRNIEPTWDDAKLTPSIQQKIKNSPDKDIKLVDATFPTKITVKRKTEKGNTIEKRIDGFRYVVIDQGTGDIIVDREQRSSPWVIFRWSVMPNEIYGRGPLMLALADVKTINKTKELILKNASIKTSGAWTVADDGIININNIRIRPGAKIPVSANPGSINGPTIAPLAMPGDFNVAQLVLQDLKTSINELMFTNPFGSLDLPVRTATEMSLRQQELSKQIGSAFGRLDFEAVKPITQRFLFVLEEMGKIDLNDFRVDGEFIAIESISPLAQAQDQEELTSMLRYAEILTGTFGPQVALMLLKPDKFSSKAAEFLNIPADIVPTPEEFEQLKQALGQMAAAQVQQPPAEGGQG
jgi:hypothetical protein